MIMAHVSISNHEKSQRMKWTKYNDKLNKDEDISLKSWNNDNNPCQNLRVFLWNLFLILEERK